jgi:chitinase
MIKTSLLLALVCIGLSNCVKDPKVVCYYESWFAYPDSHGKGTMDIKDIDSSACTHIVYGYLGVTSSADVSILDTTLVTQYHQFENLLKYKGADKVLVAIGGFNHAAELKYAVQNPTIFSSNVQTFLKKYSFDGIVIEWSSSAWSGEYMKDLVALLAHLKTDFAGKYVLGSIVAAEQPSYDIKGVAENVDFVSVQTFDYHGSWNTEVGHGAALEDIERSMNRWADSLDADLYSKLLITLPFYGHTWILMDPKEHDIGAKAKTTGQPVGPFTQQPGKYAYNEVLLKIKDSPTGWSKVEDPKAGGTYFYKDDLWITVEDEANVKAKTNWATSAGFGGVSVQAINNDDFNGLVGKKHPLLTAVNDGLNKDPIVIHKTTTSSPIVTPDPHAICQKEGWVKDPTDPCTTYHHCIEFMPTIFTDEVHHCEKGKTAYDEVTHDCIDHTKVPGC